MQINKIQKITPSSYSGVVCNIEVEKDNSYITKSFVVHNCEPSAGYDIFFDRNSLERQITKEPLRTVAGFKIFYEYNPSHRYGAGADVGGGVGLDHSTTCFWDFSTMPARVVATFKSNTIKPDIFGDEIKNEAERFGEPIVAPENNKFDMCIGRLKQIYKNIYFTEQKETRAGIPPKTRTYGWNTNRMSLVLNTPILTPSGWKKIGNLSVDEFVIGSDGKQVRVLGVYPQGYLDVWEVKTSDGSTTYCSDNHLWAIKSKYYKDAKHRVLQTKQLKSDKNKMYIPLISPVNFKKKKLPIDPYFLGLLLGDGSFGKTIGFATEDVELIDIISKLLPKDIKIKATSSKYTYTISRSRKFSCFGQNELQKHLIKLGLRDTRSHTKFIPEIYKLSSVDDRLAILRGLMDTDGCAMSHSSASFTSTSKKLAKDVKDLVLSLGGYSKVKIYKNDYGLVYTVCVQLFENPFSLKRKVDKYGSRDTIGRRNIVSVKKLNRKEKMVCIEVNAEDKLFIIEDYLLTHNTKPKMLFDLKKAIEDGHAELTDADLVAELKSYTRDDLMDVEDDPRLTTRHFDLLTACFVKGTPILTDKGQRPIETISIGDIVMTRNGYKKVVSTFNHIQPVITNINLTGTPNHPVFCNDNQIKDLSGVSRSDILYIWNLKAQKIERLSYTKARHIIDTQMQTKEITGSILTEEQNGRNQQPTYIGKYGLIILGIFRKALLYITKIIILSIMTLKILVYCLLANILRYIQQKKEKSNSEQILRKTEKISIEELKNTIKIKNQEKLSVPFARNLLKRFQKMLFFVRDSVFKDVMGKEKRDLNKRRFVQFAVKCLKLVFLLKKDVLLNALLCETKNQNKKKFVLFVEQYLKLAFYGKKDVQRNVKQRNIEKHTKKDIFQRVYNIQVADCPEYFANNILVHNCAIGFQMRNWAEVKSTEQVYRQPDYQSPMMDN